MQTDFLCACCSHDHASYFSVSALIPSYLCQSCFPKYQSQGADSLFPIAYQHTFQQLNNDVSRLRGKVREKDECFEKIAILEAAEAESIVNARALLQECNAVYNQWLHSNHNNFVTLMESLKKETEQATFRSEFQNSELCFALIQAQNLESEARMMFPIPEESTLKRLLEQARNSCLKSDRVIASELERTLAQRLSAIGSNLKRITKQFEERGMMGRPRRSQSGEYFAQPGEPVFMGGLPMGSLQMNKPGPPMGSSPMMNKFGMGPPTAGQPMGGMGSPPMMNKLGMGPPTAGQPMGGQQGMGGPPMGGMGSPPMMNKSGMGPPMARQSMGGQQGMGGMGSPPMMNRLGMGPPTAGQPMGGQQGMGGPPMGGMGSLPMMNKPGMGPPMSAPPMMINKPGMPMGGSMGMPMGGPGGEQQGGRMQFGQSQGGGMPDPGPYKFAMPRR